MNAHISDELPRMLTGEASRDEVLSAAEHLRSCVDCQHELVSAVVAHASLTSAQRFAPEIVSGMLTGNFAEAERPEHPRELHAVDDLDGDDPDADPHAELGDVHTISDATRTGRSDTESPALPDLSSVFAMARLEAAAPAQQGARHASPQDAQPRRRSRYLIGAAAAAVLIGSAATAYGVTSSGDSSGTASAMRTVQLSAYDAGRTSATAKVGDGKIVVDASSLPALASKRYEVWLTNSQRTRLQPIGWVGNDGTASLTVPTDVMQQFQDIEVSVQPVQANDYTYSGTSVLRGSMQ